MKITVYLNHLYTVKLQLEKMILRGVVICYRQGRLNPPCCLERQNLGEKSGSSNEVCWRMHVTIQTKVHF